MAHRQRVVWYEGMCLDPQHFQQWDRHHRYILDSNLRAIAPYGWGVSEIVIDKDALANGQFVLLRSRGIFPDGLIFDIPTEDPVPVSRSIKDIFRPTDSRLLAYLTVPAERERGRSCRLEGDADTRDTRFLFKNIMVTDDNSGGDERAIGVGQANFQIRFGNESTEDLCSLKIADIVRAADGSFTLSDKFIPPSLALEASDNLMGITRRLVELLVARTSALSTALSGVQSGDLLPQDFRFFLALQTLNAYVPIINHYFTAPKLHPENLFRELLGLAGQLSTFSSEGEAQPRQLPRYDHDNLSECFFPLDLQIRIILDSLVPSAKYASIPLEQKGESLYVSRTIDPGLLQKARFFMTVGGDLPERRIIDEVPNNFRVSSPDTMSMILSSFRKALLLKYIASPPAGLPQRERTYYFQLDPTGPFWEAICRSNALAIFVPKELRHLVIEVLAL
jgi:type VI secretion system protein ImpJ